MGDSKKKTWSDRFAIYILAAIIFGGLIYYNFFLTPKNSIELHQKLQFADDFEQAQKYVLEGYEDNFSEEDFDFIQENNANRVGQFSLFEYNGKSYVIMTSPGTEKLKVLDVKELPEEAREFFWEFGK